MKAQDPVAQAEAARLVAGLAQFFVLARLLTVTEYGELAILYFVASIAAPFINARATMLTVKRAATGEREHVLLRAAALSAVAGLLLALGLGGVTAAGGFLAGGGIAIGCVLASEICAGTMLQGIASIHQGRMELVRYRNWVVAGALCRIASVGVFTALASHSLLGWSVTVAAVSVPTAVVGYLTALRSAAGVASAPAVDEPIAPGVGSWDTSIFALNALTLRASDDADKAILAAFESYASVGVYTVAYRVASYVLFPSRAVMGRFMPAIFREGLKETPDWTRVVREARRELISMLAVATPVLAAAAVLAPLALGGAYAHAAPMALALIPLLALRGFHWIYGDVLIAVGRVRSRLLGQVVSLVVPMIAYLLLIPWLGAWGAVVGTGLGEVIAIVVMRHIAVRETGSLRAAPSAGASPLKPLVAKGA